MTRHTITVDGRTYEYDQAAPHNHLATLRLLPSTCLRCAYLIYARPQRDEMVYQAPTAAEAASMLRGVQAELDEAAALRAAMDDPEPAAPEDAAPQERAQALVRRALANNEAATREYPTVVVLEGELAQYAATAGAGSGKNGAAEFVQRLVALGRDGRLVLEQELGRFWLQYATLEEMDTAAHLAAYGLRPSFTPRSVVPKRPATALITARDAAGRLTADSRVVVGLSSQPIPVRVAHHPYGAGEAVRINEALALMGYQACNPFSLARHLPELRVVPVRRDRAIRLARQVAALRCQVAAERAAHQRTLAHLRGDDVPDAAWLDSTGTPLFF